MPAAFQPLKQIGPAETHQALSGAGKILQLRRFCLGRRIMGRRGEIITESIARQIEPVDGVDHVGSVKPRVLVGRVLFVDAKFRGHGLSGREIAT